MLRAMQMIDLAGSHSLKRQVLLTPWTEEGLDEAQGGYDLPKLSPAKKKKEIARADTPPKCQLISEMGC